MASRPTAKTDRFTNHFTGLLVLLFLYLLHPIIFGPSDTFVLKLLLSLIFIWSIFGTYNQKKHRAAILVMAVLAFTVKWFHHIWPKDIFLIYADDTFTVLFLGGVTFLILKIILQQKTILKDTIAGAISVYLILGIMFGATYKLINALHPGSFAITGEGLSSIHTTGNLFLYYSFVVLSTLGFGDVTPLSEAARALTICEAMLGQLYLAVFVAVMVGKHLVQAGTKDS